MNAAKNSEQQVEAERTSPVGGFTTLMATIIDLIVSMPPIAIGVHLTGLQPSDGIPFFLSGLLALVPWLYALLARRGKVFSVGLWSVGVKRIDSLDDKGRLRVSYVREGCSPQTLSRRAIGVAAYLGAGMLTIYLIAP